jgi:isopenicillin N synthase-like dioxygenase
MTREPNSYIKYSPVDVEARPDALVVNLGEMVEATTGGSLRATPHRVVNRSRNRPRVSIPVFINPPLETLVELRPRAPALDRSHVHRVLPSGALASFVFTAGDAPRAVGRARYGRGRGRTL